MKEAMCMGLHVRGKIENKQVGDEWWNRWWNVLREMGLMGIER